MPNANRFWVGSANVNWTNTANWSSVSTTGPTGASVPDATDDVYFDANSANCTVNSTSTCKNISFRGLTGSSDYTGTFTLNGTSNVPLNISGGLTLSPVMTIPANASAFTFVGSGSYNIICNGKTDAAAFTFNNASGNWTFTDTFSTTSRGTTLTNGTVNFITTATLFILTITGGTLNINGTATVTSNRNVTLSGGVLNINSPNVSLASNSGYGILLSSTGSLNINNDTVTNRINVTGGTAFTIASGKTLTLLGGTTGTPTPNIQNITFEIYNNPTTTSFIGSIIKFTGTAGIVTFAGNNLTYGTIWFSRGAATSGNRITGSNTIATLIDDGTVAHNLSFGDGWNGTTYTTGGTQTITTAFNVNGSSSSNRIVLNSIAGTGATAFNLNYTGSGSVECNYLDVRNSSGLPYTSGSEDYTWFAFGSIQSGTVTGWSVVDARYWVGGTGNWNDTTKWALTSGGSGGNTIPNSSRTAIFDANSGTGTVTINVAASCYNFDCSASLSGLSISGGNTITVYNNADLSSSFSGYSNQLIMRCSSGRTIYLNTNNNNLACIVTIYGSGSVILKSNLTTSSYLYHDAGTFDTKFGSTSYNVTCTYYYNTASNATTLNLNSSIFTCTSKTVSNIAWISGYSTATLNAGTSSIVFTDSTNSTLIFQGGSKTYNLVHFDRGASTGTIQATIGASFGAGNTFNEFRDTGTGLHTIQFTSYGVNTFNIFNVNGSSSGTKITIDETGGSASFCSFNSTNSDITFCNNINVTNCAATPAKKFYANATNSTIGVNTTGWNDPRSPLGLLGVG